MIPIETLPTIGKIASVCSNCHQKGHRAEGNKGKKDCVLDKCKSYFICGQSQDTQNTLHIWLRRKKNLT